ncbi:MAG: hypothetical protein Q8K68_10155, partial [Nitrospirota bacterium]|nr:hypothetical protein [Nitrospirota bacterium]
MLAILILVLVAAYAAYTFIPAVRETMRPIEVSIVNASVSEDIESAYFLHTQGQVTKTYTREDGVFANVEESEPVISEDRRTGTHARILRSGSSEFAVVVDDVTI